MVEGEERSGGSNLCSHVAYGGHAWRQTERERGRERERERERGREREREGERKREREREQKKLNQLVDHQPGIVGIIIIAWLNPVQGSPVSVESFPSSHSWLWRQCLASLSRMLQYKHVHGSLTDQCRRWSRFQGRGTL